MDRLRCLLVAGVLAVAASVVAAGPAAAKGGNNPKAHAAVSPITGTTSQGFPFRLRFASAFRRVVFNTQVQISCADGRTFTDGLGMSGESRPFTGGSSGHRTFFRITYNISGSRSGLIVTPGGDFLGIGSGEATLTGNLRLDALPKWDGDLRGTIRTTLTIQPTPLSAGNRCTSGDAPITYSKRF